MTAEQHKIPVAEPTPQWVKDALKRAWKEGITEITLDGRTWIYVNNNNNNNKTPDGSGINGWVTDATLEERQQVFDDIEKRDLERWK